MISLIKQTIQQALGKIGYTLVKQPTRSDRTRASSIAFQPPSLKAALVRLLEDAVAHITGKRISGDIVDCGTGETIHLYGLATALKLRSDTSRKLILFDTSMDPAHRAEKIMPLWGSRNQAPFPDVHKPSQPARAAEEALPRELIATGYPAKNISIETHATDRAIRSKLSQQIAILILTCDTHKANSMVLEKVLPQLAKGATIIVRGYSPAIAEGNNAISLLRKHVPELVLTHVWDSYWTALA
jgi:hypothetical protein